MKNSQKGLVVGLIIGIIVVLLISAGVYVYENKKSEAPVYPTAETQTSSLAVPTNSQSESDSLVSTATWKTGNNYAAYPADVVMDPRSDNTESTYTFPSKYFSGSSISSAKVTIYGTCGNDEPPTNIVIEGLKFYKSADGLAYYLPGVCNTEFVLSIATGIPTDVNSAAYRNLKNIFYTMVDSVAKKSQASATTQPAKSSCSPNCPGVGMGEGVAYTEISVLGMRQYTDSSFGFSFWYPSSMQVTKTQPQLNSGSSVNDSTIMNGPNTQILGVITAPEFTAYEVYSPDMSILSSVDPGPSGSDYDKYFFDTQTHTWMYASDGGPTGVAGGTTAADTSNNTIGGLHVFNGYTRFGYKVIIPLSANDFIVVYAKCNDATNYTCEGTNGAAGTALDRFKASIKTIVAVDPSVATPISVVQQTAIIQAEANTYVGYTAPVPPPPGPTITSMSPTTAKPGDTITIYGSNFTLDSEVMISSEVGMTFKPTSISSTMLTFIVPSAAVLAQIKSDHQFPFTVTVENKNGSSNWPGPILTISQ